MKYKFDKYITKLNKLYNKRDRAQLMQVFGLLLVILSPILWMISFSSMEILNTFGLGFLSLPTTMFFTALSGGMLWAIGKDKEINVMDAIEEIKKSSNDVTNTLNNDKKLNNNKEIEFLKSTENYTENDNSTIQSEITLIVETQNNIDKPKQFIKKKNNQFHN